MSPETTFLAITPPGLEAVAASDLRDAGIAGAQPGEGGATFEGGLVECCRANLWSRIATRVVARVANVRAPSFQALEQGVAAVDWDALLEPGARVHVRAAVHHSPLRSAERVARAVTRALPRPTAAPTDRRDAHLVLARAVGERCVVSLDSSGERLHQRGYRAVGLRAPLRETLAAAILRLAGWTPAQPLVDPMCGSGTFLVEAASMAMALAPGRQRSFAFERWPGFRADVWRALLDEADAARRPAPPAPIIGADRAPRAVEAAQRAAERAGVAPHVVVEERPVSELAAPAGSPGLVVCNPPYGVRLGTRGAVRPVYAQLGHVLATRFRGWRAAILCPDRRLERELKLLVVSRTPLRTGGRPVELVMAAL